MTLYTVTVKESGLEEVEDLGFQMPYDVAEDFAARCNKNYGALGRNYRATSVNQAERGAVVAEDAA